MFGSLETQPNLIAFSPSERYGRTPRSVPFNSSFLPFDVPSCRHRSSSVLSTTSRITLYVRLDLLSKLADILAGST
ncbi:hypothetical protein LINGRAHAP2_LOCUS8312 [Linum grandiflorum]